MLPFVLKPDRWLVLPWGWTAGSLQHLPVRSRDLPRNHRIRHYLPDWIFVARGCDKSLNPSPDIAHVYCSRTACKLAPGGGRQTLPVWNPVATSSNS